MNFNIRLSLYFLMLLCCTMGTAFAQNAANKTVSYAGIEIEVPGDYLVENLFSIKNEDFSVQWLYLTLEMAAEGVDKQLLKQLQDQLSYHKARKIKFTSQNNSFSGKVYTLKTDGPLKYRILASGSVNGQPLILNLGFKNDPKTHKALDNLAKQFVNFGR